MRVRDGGRQENGGVIILLHGDRSDDPTDVEQVARQILEELKAVDVRTYRIRYLMGLRCWEALGGAVLLGSGVPVAWTIERTLKLGNTIIARTHAPLSLHK